MKKFYIASAKQGQPPGTPVYTGTRTDVPIRIRVIHYNEEQLEEREVSTVEETFAYAEATPATWINIDGLNDAPAVEKMGLYLGLHSLTIEDILHTHQRPKMEDLGDAIYMVLRMLSIDPNNDDVTSEQISFVLHKSVLVTFQEHSGDVFEGVRERIQKMQGRIRRKGADYLLYALLDAVTDHYFKVLEQFGERIEGVEAALMEDPYPELLNEIYAMKRELLYIRKSVWPLREAIGSLERGESELFEDGTQKYLRDLYDHTIQVIDTIESFRDMLSGVQDLYLSSLGNKTNQVMKVLTIIATIFIPITFIAGIYGMNFEVIPELQWKYGYAAVWVVMIVMTFGMLAYFKRKRWF
ncbi:magnesium/cobalt transporter CorA [Pontiellaceae bacterium B1224]|nr:magnesium/cobalt transporter CorA [Pontiellaceae bacterium B1224]